MLSRQTGLRLLPADPYQTARFVTLGEASLCIGSPLSRCCRLPTLHALLQRWMRNSFLQSLGTIKMTLGAVSLGSEVQNHQPRPCAQSELLFSALCSLAVKVCLSSPGIELCKTVQFNLPSASFEQTHQYPAYEVFHYCHCLFRFTDRQQLSRFIQENYIIPFCLL